MRARRKELNVDFIGEQVPLTETEEKMISEFFKNSSKTLKKSSQRIKLPK
jgi:hypothetical protein